MIEATSVTPDSLYFSLLTCWLLGHLEQWEHLGTWRALQRHQVTR